MKSAIRFICISLLLVFLFVSSFATVNAANNATVNGESASVGDVVTYTFNISDCTQNILGVHLVIFFDQSVLSLKTVSDNLGAGTMINDYQNGRIVIINSFVGDSGGGLECSEKTEIVTASFEVLTSSDTEISYYIPYLYDSELTNIYNYTFTYDLAVNGSQVISDEPPVLASSQQIFMLPDVGDFENTVEGFSRQYDNYDSEDSFGDVEGFPSQDDSYSDVFDESEDNIFDFDKSQPAESSTTGISGVLIVLILLLLGIPLLVVAAVVVVVIIVIVVSKKKKNKQKQQSEQEKQNDPI